MVDAIVMFFSQQGIQYVTCPISPYSFGNRVMVLSRGEDISDAGRGVEVSGPT